ncbi:MAG TPA: efflux RND transporter periplasmic adaptor subunit [Alphaproteobacteria bacterium]|nr:efflux RND transporter periplasmic adaptor subunit [Alphaproteobacteria bacterium]
MYNSSLVINYMGKIMRSALIQTLTVIFVAVLSWLIWDKWDVITGSGASKNNSTKSESPPTAVDAKSVRLDNIIVNMEIIGNLRASDAIDVTSEVNGIITEIKFTEGQAIKKGNILFLLDASIEKAEISIQKADVNRWTALLERRQRLARSAEKLSETKNIARTRLDQLLTDETEALAQLQIAKAALQIAERRFYKKIVRAPFNGIVGLKLKSIGEYLEPGEVITSLDSIDPIELDFEVPESAISALEIGAEINAFTRAWGNEVFSGIVKSINTRVNLESRSITVRAKINNTNLKLKPGMFMIVKLPVVTHKNAIIIPEEAVLTDGTLRTVYVIKDGITNSKAVKLGQRLPGEVEVLEGISSDAIVITGGIQKVRDGSKVTIR